MNAANIEASKLLLFLWRWKIIPKDFQMLVVCICYCYNFHIFLSFASESMSSQIYNTNPERYPEDWQDLMMVLGSAVMKEEDL